MELGIKSRVYLDALNVFKEQPVNKALAKTLEDLAKQARTAFVQKMTTEYGATRSTINYLIHQPRVTRSGNISAKIEAFKKGISLGNYSPMQSGVRYRKKKGAYHPGKGSVYMLKFSKGERGNVSIAIKGKREFLPSNYFMIASWKGGKAVLKRVSQHIKGGTEWQGVETALGPGPAYVGGTDFFNRELENLMGQKFEDRFKHHLSFYLGGVMKK
jgi:hypothetical protein